MREVFRSPRLVKQKRQDDCGIAAVAMIARTSYRKVERKYREVFPGELGFRTKPKDVRKLLKKLEAPVRLGPRVPCPRLDWPRIKKTALAAINSNKVGDEWHWVVYVHGSPPYVLDPRIGRRTDWRRMRLAWYHTLACHPEE